MRREFEEEKKKKGTPFILLGPGHHHGVSGKWLTNFRSNSYTFVLINY